MKEENIKSVHNCKVCDIALSTDLLLVKHMLDCHTEPKDTAARVVEEILCIVYEKVFDTSSGIDIHLTNKQSTDIKDKVHDNASEPVRLESLLSCNQCDFDTDNNDSLLTHYKKNMHDVLNLNKTLEEKNTTQEVEVETERIKENRNNTELSCHLCEYSTKY